MNKAALLSTTMLMSLGSVACYAPQRTGGANEALAIYRQHAQPARLDRSTGRDPRSAGAGVGTAANVHDAPVTVEAAISLAKKNSARLAELEARASAANAAIDAAGQPKNPELRDTSMPVGQAIDRRQALRLNPRVRFSPERPGELAAREAAAKATRDEARAEAHAHAIAIEGEIRWLFDDVLLLDAEIAAHERAAATRRKLAAQARERVTAEAATDLDANLADLYSIESDAEVAELRARRAILVASLLDRTGLAAGPDLDVDLVGDAAAWPPPPLPSEHVLIEAALRRSPEVTASAARIDASDARLHLEKSRRWPWFTFIDVGYDIEPSVNGVPHFTFGAGVELPIFHMNGGGVRHAEASMTAAKKRLTTEVERIEREVRSHLREANEAASLVTAYRTASTPVLDRARAEAARALEAGAIDMVRALTIEERANLVEVKLYRLLRRYRTAVDGLRRTVGGPLPP